MEGRIHGKEAPQSLGHRCKLCIRENAVDAAIEPPDQIPRFDVLQNESADAMDRARAELGLDHQHSLRLPLGRCGGNRTCAAWFRAEPNTSERAPLPF